MYCECEWDNRRDAQLVTLLNVKDLKATVKGLHCLCKVWNVVCKLISLQALPRIQQAPRKQIVFG